MTSRAVLWAIIAIQAASAAFFVGDILISVLGLPVEPFSWMFVELIQIGAAISLLTGLVMGGIFLQQTRQKTRAAEEALRVARGAFRDVMEERFLGWNLTPAERDVALFAIKGFSLAEIAELRDVSEGTIKAQSAAIYRKAGVSGRSQLLSVFVDELVQDV